MKETVEVFWFSEQAYGHVSDSDLEKYDSGRLGSLILFLTPRKRMCFTTNITSNMPSQTRWGLTG